MRDADDRSGKPDVEPDSDDVAVGKKRGQAAYTSAPAATYADPGYLPDGKKRYPLDTPAHIDAAPGLFAQNANKYPPDQRNKIRAAIAAATSKEQRRTAA